MRRGQKFGAESTFPEGMGTRAPRCEVGLDLLAGGCRVCGLVALALRASPGIFDACMRVTTLPNPLAASEDAPTPRPVARLMPPDSELLG